MNCANNESSNTESRRRTLERTTSPQSVAYFPSPTRPCKMDSDNNNKDNKTIRTISSDSSSAVSFNRRVTMLLIRSHREYKPKEIKRCFYQAEELKAITDQCFEDIQRPLFQGDQDNHKAQSYCQRGLESLEEFDRKEKLRLRTEAYNKVFDAQDKGSDEMAIAREYASATFRCQRWAHIMGLRDRRAVIAFQREE